MEKKLELLEEIFDMESGELKPEMELDKIGCWDSMAKLSFIVLMSDEYGKKISGDEIKKIKTINDMLTIME